MGRREPGAVIGTEATRLVLFGAARVERSGRRLPLTETLVRLLAYLAIDGGPVRRSTLAGILWPSCPDQRAMGNLRSALWRIHRVERSLVEIGASTLTLGAGVGVDARDVVVATRALLQPQEHDVRSFLWLIDDARLLPGWDEPWVVFERERQRQLRLHALEALADLLCARGDCGDALDAALAAVRIEPLRESAHRAVIRVHLAEGNLVEARRQYASCVRLLGAELGVAPSPATRRLFPSNPGRAPSLPVGRA
jgi:DNA-binding SARP family transcriptional activator